MKTIRSKIMLCMTITLSAALLILGVITMCFNYNSTITTLDQALTETAKIAAERVQQELTGYANVCGEVGSIPDLSNDWVSTAEKQQLIDSRAEYFGFTRGNLLDANGISVFTGQDFSDRDYFKSSMQGNVSVSDPLMSKVTGKQSIIISAPVWKGGKPGGEVTGVVYFVPTETFLSDIMATIKVGKNGTAFMIDKAGITIADTNIDNVNRQENTIEEAKSDPQLRSLAALEEKMIAGENGYGTYKYGGREKVLAYCPVGGTNGWSIAVCAPLREFLTSTYLGIGVTLAVIVLSCAISIFIAWRLASGIGKPAAACARRLKALAEGDLKSEVPECASKDEIGVLVQATRELKEDMSAVIGDMDYLLTHMSAGDFTVHTRCPEAYAGDFHSLLDAELLLKQQLIETLREMDVASDQVASGADQVASGAQALAQGSTEQASSVEELAATINDISNNINSAADSARDAEKSNREAHVQIEQCSGQMNDLVKAIQEIDGKSAEISKIIKTIEDIAFQTNILALNAAVEAARAGAAGKGFAVVADEVRDLATKSQAAAKSTTTLIDETVRAVAEGTRLSGETEQALQQVVEISREVLDAVSVISTATVEQAQAVGQVSVGIDQISSVVQTNSATSEQSAAASEELSGQARLLKELVSRFKLPGEVGTRGRW